MLHQTDHVTHVKECNAYGIKPLTGAQICKMHTHGLYKLSDAYSIACDLSCGFTWNEAIAARKRAK